MPIVWTENEEANQLLDTDPLALLIGMVLDQQVKMEKAFIGPYELKKRLGGLDVRTIASMDPEALDRVFRERPARPGDDPGCGQGLRRRRRGRVAGSSRWGRPGEAHLEAARVWRDEDEDHDLGTRQEVRGQAAGLGEARGQLALGGRRRLARVHGAGAGGQTRDEGSEVCRMIC